MRHPIEARLEFMQPDSLGHQDRYQLVECYRQHHRELIALAQDGFKALVLVGNNPDTTVGALEFAQTELDLLRQISGLLAQAHEEDQRREAA